MEGQQDNPLKTPLATSSTRVMTQITSSSSAEKQGTPIMVDDDEEENEEVAYKGVPKEVGPLEQTQFDEVSEMVRQLKA